VYVFKCIECEKVHEYLIKAEDLEETEKSLYCEKCGGQLMRKLAPFVSHFNYTRGK
jgi:DNA-directed RNA polymerase subunit RPC12/RpoP